MLKIIFVKIFIVGNLENIKKCKEKKLSVITSSPDCKSDCNCQFRPDPTNRHPLRKSEIGEDAGWAKGR